eukprot:XP_014777742.1 PREDICTED: muscleblind-like protein 2 [Octopus bimaculoides]
MVKIIVAVSNCQKETKEKWTKENLDRSQEMDRQIISGHPTSCATTMTDQENWATVCHNYMHPSEVCREFQRCTCTRQPNDCRYAHPPENVTVDPSDNMVTVCMDYMKGKCTRDTCKYFHPPHHLQAQIKAVQQRANAVAVPTRALPQVVEVLTGKKRPREPADDLVTLGGLTGAPYAKRVAVADSKSGVPVYQPGNVAYQQALAMQLQQPYLPVTYSSTKLNEIQPYFTYSSTKLNEPYFTFAGHPPTVPRF